jgi:hypothetical protein
MASPHLLHIFWDVDFRNGHDGLNQIAKEKKIQIRNMPHGEMVLFVNSKRNMIKVLASTGEENSNGVVAFYKCPRGRINEYSLQFIAQAFRGGEIRYDEALKRGLLKQLGVKNV